MFDRIAKLDRRMIELEHFKKKPERIQEGKDREARIYRWKGAEEQLKGWRPDINDVIRINIAPRERLGIFPVKKIVGNVEMGEQDTDLHKSSWINQKENPCSSVSHLSLSVTILSILFFIEGEVNHESDTSFRGEIPSEVQETS